LGWFSIAVLLIPIATFKKSGRDFFRAHGKAHYLFSIWAVLSVLCWCFLMFKPEAVIFLGSYSVLIVGFALCSSFIEAAGKFWVILISVLQALLFFTTWSASNEGMSHLFYLPSLLAALAAVAGFIFISLGKETAGSPELA
jgi:hypothetical protein